MSEEGTPVLLNTEGGDTEDVEEEEEEVLSSEPCLCLFCSSEQLSATATLDHCRKEHGVDLLLIATKLGRNPRSWCILNHDMRIYFS